jgi:hypothetical protein
LVKGNGARHANSGKLHAVLNYPWKFAKRAQITFGAVAKGNLLPFGMYEKKAKKIPFLMTVRIISCES